MRGAEFQGLNSLIQFLSWLVNRGVFEFECFLFVIEFFGFSLHIKLDCGVGQSETGFINIPSNAQLHSVLLTVTGYVLNIISTFDLLIFNALLYLECMP